MESSNIFHRLKEPEYADPDELVSLMGPIVKKFRRVKAR